MSKSLFFNSIIRDKEKCDEKNSRTLLDNLVTTCHKGFIDFDAGDGVERSIGQLLGIELVGFPVGETLALAELLMEEKGVNLGQAEVGDAVVLDQRLQLDKTFRFKRLAPFAEVLEIILCREPDLDEIGVFEQRLETIGKFLYLVEPEQIAHLPHRKLHKAHTIGDALLERRTRLGVEADELGRFAYLSDSDFGLFQIDDCYRVSGKLLDGKFGELFLADGIRNCLRCSHLLRLRLYYIRGRATDA